MRLASLDSLSITSYSVFTFHSFNFWIHFFPNFISFAFIFIWSSNFELLMKLNVSTNLNDIIDKNFYNTFISNCKIFLYIMISRTKMQADSIFRFCLQKQVFKCAKNQIINFEVLTCVHPDTMYMKLEFIFGTNIIRSVNIVMSWCDSSATLWNYRLT